MKAKYLNCWFSLSIILSQSVIAQNLVPNPSFENYSTCPNLFSQISYCTSWQNANKGNSDYFNSCASTLTGVPYNDGDYGFQFAKTGEAYSGFWFYNTNSREYIQAKLLTPLQTNNCYFVKFYCNKKNKLRYSINNIAAHISIDTFAKDPFNSVLNLTPHIHKIGNPIIKDTLNWVEVSGIYYAIGGEQYITIGNFKTNAETDTLKTFDDSYPGAYYYIDDVSVINISDLGGMPANAGPDVSVAPGDSVFVGQDISNLNCTWSVLGGGLITSNVSGIYVKPTVMTTYVVEQTLCGVTSTDTVNVYLTNGLSDEYRSPRITVFPNPAQEFFYLQSENDNSNWTIALLDLSGREVPIQSDFVSSKQIKISTQMLPDGMYLLQMNHGTIKLIVQHW